MGVKQIDTEELLQDILKRLSVKDESYLLPSERVIVDMVKNAPESTACWVDDISGMGYYANCSKCGYQIDVHENRGYYRFCPECGRKMV